MGEKVETEQLWCPTSQGLPGGQLESPQDIFSVHTYTFVTSGLYTCLPRMSVSV